MTTLTMVNEIKSVVVVAGFAAILAWGWIRCGVSPLEVVRELVRR